MKESKEAIIEERDEQLRIMEGVLQAKETIIDQLQTDVEYYKSQISEAENEAKRQKRYADIAEKNREKEAKEYQELLKSKENILYINTQWGNNVIVSNNNINIVTKTQWGSNIKVNSVFPALDNTVNRIFNKINKDECSKKYAEKYGWEKINFGKDGKND